MRFHTFLAIAFVFILAPATATGCGESSAAPRPPSRSADVRGTVTSVDRTQGRAMTILIDRGGACALSTRIPADLRVLRETDGARVEASLDDLAAGQTVDAWVGAIAESCPEQTTAATIVIVG
jgi:hypothetical protein